MDSRHARIASEGIAARATLRAMYEAMFGQFQKQLRQVDGWLDKAEAHAKERSFDPNVLLASRLAPDQFPLLKQVQATCDVAKLAAARLTGKDAPEHADTETTVAELRTRIQSVLAFLGGLVAADFADAATRSVTQPRWEGRVMTGHDYFLEHGLPNFYFHLTHVYALLRHNGVNVGKRDYLGQLTQRLP
jgi:hypothetical protein